MLAEVVRLTDKIFDVGRGTYSTNGELGGGNTEFYEPDEEDIFCLIPHSAIRIPQSSFGRNDTCGFHRCRRVALRFYHWPR
jgi:hypothetical protein